jgi:O-antigen/teichoic acid export membrane protein
MGSATVITGLSGALSSAILGRVLGVEAFGVFALLIAFIGMMADLGDVGFTATFVRFGSASIAAGDTGRFRDVVAVMLRLKVVLTLLILLLSVLLLQGLVPSTFGHLDEALTAYSGLTLAIILVSVTAGIFYPIYQSYQDFRTHSLLNIGRGLAKLALLCFVVAAVAGFGVASALWIELAAVSLFLVLSYRSSPFRLFTLHVSDRTLTRSMMVFNRWIIFAQIAGVVAARLDLFFVGGMMDRESLGLYGAAAKIAGLTLSLTNAYYAVLLAGVSSATSGETLRAKIRNAWRAVGLISLGILMLATFAGPLVAIIFGGRFEGAETILQVMCPGLLFSVLAYPMNAFLFARSHSVVFALTAGASLVGVVCVSLLLIPGLGAVGAALAYSTSAFAAFVVSAVYFSRRRGVAGPSVR